MTSTSRFPKSFLYSLRSLRSLSLNRGDHWLLGSVEHFVATLAELDTSKLETLRLVSGEILEMLSGDFLASAYDDLPGMLDLSTRFPELRHLILDVQTRMHGMQENHKLPRLPPNLTYLSTPLITLDSNSGPIFAKLPRYLETWISDFRINRMGATKIEGLTLAESVSAELRRIFANAPPRLSTLGVLGPDKFSVFDYSFLPQTIEHLSIASLSIQDTTTDLIALPSCLTSLKLSSVPVNSENPVDWLAFLPRQLQTFSARFLLRQPHFTAASLRLLPPSLTHLAWNGMTGMQSLIDWDDMETSFPASSWPTGLSTLLLSDEPMSQSTLDHRLPPALTSLACLWKDEPICVPQGLKSFELAVPHYSLWPSYTQIMPSILPKGTPIPIATMKISTLAPASQLTNLELVLGYEIPTDFLDHISLPHIRSLRTSGWSAKAFGKLPRTLTSFRCGRVQHLTGPDVQALGDIFADLPTGLRSLSMWGSVDFKAENAFSRLCFSSTPQLETISLHGFGVFEAGVLKNLPALAPSTCFIHLAVLNEEDERELESAKNFEAGKMNVQPKEASKRLANMVTTRAKLFPDPRVLPPSLP